VSSAEAGAGATDALKARLALVVAAALFSTGGAAIKATTLNAFQVAAFRSLVAAVAIALAIPAARRGWTRWTWVAALAYGATMAFFVLATKNTTAANAIFLQSTAPLYVLLLGPLLLDEPIRPRDFAFIAAFAAGMALFFVDSTQVTAIAANPRLGNLLALASGICWALTLVSFRYLEKRNRRGGASTSAQSVLVAGNVVAFAVCLPLAFPVPTLSATDIAAVGYLGIFQIGLAYLFFVRGIRHVSALEASLLILLEPVLNPLWAWLLHGERPGPWANLGAAVLLLTMGLRAVLTAREERAATLASPD
jgi:drug/metabolite transporter (DMT)-like permease